MMLVSPLERFCVQMGSDIAPPLFTMQLIWRAKLPDHAHKPQLLMGEVVVVVAVRFIVPPHIVFNISTGEELNPGGGGAETMHNAT